MTHTRAVLALVLGFASAAMADNHGFSDVVKKLPPCAKAPPASVPGSWKTEALGESFSIALPPCIRDTAQGQHYVHGGTLWRCGTTTVEVVWGMWGPTSFGESGARCTTRVAGQRVMVVLDRHDDGPAVLVWYPTESPNEPIVSVWSSRAEEAETVAAIAFSGRIKPRK